MRGRRGILVEQHLQALFDIKGGNGMHEQCTCFPFAISARNVAITKKKLVCSEWGGGGGGGGSLVRQPPPEKLEGSGQLRSRLVSAPRYWRSNQNALWFIGLAVHSDSAACSSKSKSMRNILKAHPPAFL